MATAEEVAALKASPGYQALGVVGRDRLLRTTFPEIDEAIKASAARVAATAKEGNCFDPA